MNILDYLRRNLRQVCLVFVLGYAAIYAIAFVRLYFVEHPYHSSSRWMLDNFQDKVRILGPHWDDRLPAGVPEHRRPPTVFNSEGRENELPLYEPDSPGKVDLILRRMRDADYLAFPTPRMTDSIPRIPEEMPLTTALLQLLWSEKLGFKLIKTFKNRPSFLGITFNDDLADESFSVYDHPKVTVFQNEEHLSIEEMRRRIVEAESMGPLPTMNEMLLMDEGGWVGKPPSELRARLIPLVCAFAFIQLIAFGFWGMFGGRLGFLRDRGLGLSPLLGLIFTAGVCWGLAALRIAPVTKVSAYVVVGLMAFVGMVNIASSARIREGLRESWSKYGWRAEIGLLAGVAVVCVVWLLDPNFVTLSEQVDGGYLQYFTRNESIPPVDILNPAEAMPGFYFDRFVLGWFLKGIGVSGTLGVQISMLLIGAVIGAAVCSVVGNFISRRGLAGAVSSVFVIPAVLGVLVLRESRDALPALQADQLKPEQKKLVQWLSRSIPGAPVTVDSCATSFSSGVSLAAGLPAFQRISTEQAAGSGDTAALCSSQDPQALFDTMMKYGAALYIMGTPPEGSAGEAEQAEGGIDGRPDLFAKVYDRDGLKVFAASFSNLYRRPAHS